MTRLCIYVFVLAGAITFTFSCASAQKQSLQEPQGTSAAQTDARPVAQAQTYIQTCGICHLENGEGVPGAYPPLSSRLGMWSTTNTGASYLVGVVVNGLHGAIEVDGQRYVGSMPGMSSRLSSEQIAALLNFVIENFAAGQAVFSPASVDEIRQQIADTPSLSLRPE